MRRLLFIAFLFVSALLQGQFIAGTIASQYTTEAGYTIQYQAVLDEMTTDPTGDTLTWQNNMVRDLVDSTWWGRMDLFYVFATTDNDDDEALINWIDPGGAFDATEFNSPTWDALEGYTGDGSTSYLNTNYNPTGDATNYTQNSASIAVYVRTNLQGNPVMGIDANPRVQLTPRDLSDLFYIRVNTLSASTSVSSTDSRGFWIASRTASDAIEGYKNGSSIVSESDASEGIPDGALSVLKRGGAESPLQVSISFVMDGITDTEASGINTIIETYMDAIGKGVQ